ncbi:MAG: hypothetical protein HYU36_04105 [Planctomycetes bacterium]|nr:hypothetical protein [Planctomycetota bacterium]
MDRSVGLRRNLRPLVKDRAAILIVSLGILTSLVIMGTTFVSLQRIESRSARNYADFTEAKHVAHSALAYTLERLQNGSVTLDGNFYRLGAASMAYSPDPVQFPDYYRFTLSLPLSEPQMTGFCDVGVLDCSAQVYVGNTAGAMNQLQQVLQALMQYINNYQSPATPLDPPADAAAVVAGMAQGFHSKLQVQKWLTGSAAQQADKFQAIRDYLTVHGDPDASTIRPDLSSEPRIPVNLNTVSGAVLAALLDPAVTADVTLASPPVTAEEALAGILISNRPFRGWKSPAGAPWKGLVDLLQESAVQTVMAAYYSGGAAAWQSDRDELLAGFLPNAGLSSANPSRGLSKGKDQVGPNRTTEFCLKSTGLYQIQLSASLYGDAGQTLLVRRAYEAVARAHILWKQTTQADFMTGSFFDATQVATYPENLVAFPGQPSTVDGCLGLAPLPHSGGSPNFYISFASQFDPDIVAESQLAGAVTDPATNTDDDVPLTDAAQVGFPGELCSDGAFLGRFSGPNGIAGDADDLSEAVYYESGLNMGAGKGSLHGKGIGVGLTGAKNFDPAVGTLTFWVKLSFTPAPSLSREISYLPFTDVLSDTGASYASDLVDNDGDGSVDAADPNEYLRYLWLYVEGTQLKARFVGAVETASLADGIDNDGNDGVDEPGERVPGQFLEVAVNIVSWKQGEWHYVSVIWQADGTNPSSLQLFADGQSSGALTGLPMRPGEAVHPDPQFLFTYARFGNANTGAAAADLGTLDEVRSWTSAQPALAADPGGDRYFSSGSPEFISGPFPASGMLPYGVVIGTATWTESLPPDDGTASIAVQVEVDNTGTGLFLAPVSSNSLSDPDSGALVNGIGGPLATEYQSGGAGAHLRCRVTFTPAAAASSYPGSPYGTFARRVDTPLLDDLTLTLLPPPKVIHLREE